MFNRPDVQLGDSGVAVDRGPSVISDAGDVRDVATQDMTLTTQDMRAPSDVNVPDVTQPDDSSPPPLDSGAHQKRDWPGLPRGGALGCQLQSIQGHGLLLLAILIGLRRRR